jgi:glycosyltransferase involved in cell wall biosynthesis
MHIGGPQRSLLNLLKLLDYECNEVTLMLFSLSGELLPEVPQNVNIIEIKPSHLYEKFKFFRNSFFFNLYSRILVRILSRLTNFCTINKYNWSWIVFSTKINRSTKVFDIAIAYMEGPPIYYLVDKITSKVKIGRLATDYSKIIENRFWDEKYFSNLNILFCVSEDVLKIFKDIFPEFSQKLRIFHTILLPDDLRKKALSGETFIGRPSTYKILTIARLSHEKGIDIAICACKSLIERGHSVSWYVIGDGSNGFYRDMINKSGLEDIFFILKATNNPYRFLKDCDIYVQPSRHEGRSNAILEAKVFCKPIVLTNFKTSHSHIINNYNGLISELDSDDLCRKIETFLTDRIIREKCIKSLNGINNEMDRTNNDIIQLIYNSYKC